MGCKATPRWVCGKGELGACPSPRPALHPRPLLRAPPIAARPASNPAHRPLTPPLALRPAPAAVPAMAALRAVLGVALAAVLAGAAPAAVSPPPRNVSVLLEPGSGQLRVLPGRHPAAVAWASLEDRIPAVG